MNCTDFYFYLFFCRFSALNKVSDLVSLFGDEEIPRYLLDSVDYVNNLPSPRFIKTHLPFKLLPIKLQQNTTNTKVKSHLVNFRLPKQYTNIFNIRNYFLDYTHNKKSSGRSYIFLLFCQVIRFEK